MSWPFYDTTAQIQAMERAEARSLIEPIYRCEQCSREECLCIVCAECQERHTDYVCDESLGHEDGCGFPVFGCACVASS